MEPITKRYSTANLVEKVDEEVQRILWLLLDGTMLSADGTGCNGVWLWLLRRRARESFKRGNRGAKRKGLTEGFL